MKISEILTYIESFAPLHYQEDYDNSGLLVGDPEKEVKSILLTIDTTEKVIDEAIKKGTNLIISHHPVIFKPFNKITTGSEIERAIIKAIKNDLSIYVAHTNFDNIIDGVNRKICDKLGLKKIRILRAVDNMLRKLVTFVPLDHADRVRQAIFDAGAGYIGNYDQCSYNLKGTGTFRALDGSKPFSGKRGEMNFEDEIRIETIFPEYLQNNIIESMIRAHPYDEVAYDIYPLANKYNLIGAGMTGELEKAVDEKSFLLEIKKIFNLKILRHTFLRNKKIKKVAVCGGGGSFLLRDAISAGADIFVSGDFKYHQYFDAENRILIADIGHYESEQFTTEIFYDILTKKFPKFAVYFSEVNTNPINYL